MKIIFFLFTLMLGSVIFGQEQTTKKNALYLSGDWMTKNLSATLNYERILFILGNGQFQIGSSLGYGRWFTVDSKGSNYNMNLHLITGACNRHAELTIGLRRMDNDGHNFYPEPFQDGPVGSENNQLSFKSPSDS